MSKNSLIYFVLFILLQFLLVEIDCQKNLPSQRYFHTTTFIDNKLFILGGRHTSVDTVKSLGREFFYIDFSQVFSTGYPSWNKIKNFVPQHNGATTVVGGAKNDTIFLYGGTTTYERMSMVYTYNPKNDSWMIPTLDGNDGSDISRKAFLTGIADNGKMYLWGGTESVTRYYVNNMLILDTINLAWSTGSLTNAPFPRNEYGATLLPNHKILYMGGNNGQNSGIGLDKVHIYDTINDSWDTQVTSGKIPSNRFGFSANLALDGQKIITFGGYNVSSSDATYALDLTNFSWYIPNIGGTIPSSRVYHRADVIGKYLVVTFGTGYNSSEADLLLLDISNNEQYVWTKYYGISNSSPSSPPSSIDQKAQSRKLIGIIGASVVSVMILIAGSYYLCRWNKNRRTKIAVHPPSDKLDNQIAPKVVLTMVNDNGSNSQELKQAKQ